ncbi:hypothetical protein J5893_01860 [bacterium]|nr:hypothetical protein [bacterium]
MIAVILSAQSTDKQVNKITHQLFLSVYEPADVIAMGQEKLEKAVSSVNYYKMKAKHIFQTAELLIEQGGEVPESTEDLLKLP